MLSTPGQRPGCLGRLQPHRTLLWHLWLLGRLPRRTWKGSQVLKILGIWKRFMSPGKSSKMHSYRIFHEPSSGGRPKGASTAKWVGTIVKQSELKRKANISMTFLCQKGTLGLRWWYRKGRLQLPEAQKSIFQLKSICLKKVLRFWFMPPHRLTPPFFSRYRTETEVTLFLIQYNSSRIWTLWACLTSSCMPVDYGSMTHVPSQTSKIYWEHPFNSSLPRFYYGMKFLRWLLTIKFSLM